MPNAVVTRIAFRNTETDGEKRFVTPYASAKEQAAAAEPRVGAAACGGKAGSVAAAKTCCSRFARISSGAAHQTEPSRSLPALMPDARFVLLQVVPRVGGEGVARAL